MSLKFTIFVKFVIFLNILSLKFKIFVQLWSNQIAPPLLLRLVTVEFIIVITSVGVHVALIVVLITIKPIEIYDLHENHHHSSSKHQVCSSSLHSIGQTIYIVLLQLACAIQGLWSLNIIIKNRDIYIYFNFSFRSNSTNFIPFWTYFNWKYFYLRHKNGKNRPFSFIALKCLNLSFWQPNFSNLFRFRCTLTGTHRWGPRISLSFSLGGV